MNPSVDIRILVFFGIGAMFLLFAGFLISVVFSQRKKMKYQRDVQRLREQQQNQLIEAAVKSEETERHRIAETLHDELGAILSSAKLHLFGVKHDTLDEKDKKLHEKGRELLNTVIQKVRGISHNLHSNILREFGLNEAIQHFLKQVSNGDTIKASAELDESYPAESQEQDISLYRLAQELINNILKHAGAAELKVYSHVKDNQLELTISHNGKGLTQEEFDRLSFEKEGLGLKNIRNRILLLKGAIRFSKENNWYHITVTVPINSKTNG